ncbi:uncharacterized protein LOC115188398 [Salmo trutta]|uniref:uncharacterized protein LOC115188398 n=1 Tax=Salmo trutta TaxID=8032 RepID=UPI0011324CAB|nr:uncharacterized protein LOC115188398 [Salmo trutta]
MYRTGLPITHSHAVHHATYNQQVCTGPAFPLPRHTQCITLHTTNRYVQDRPSHYPVIHSASRYIQPTGMYRTGLPITPSHTVYHATYNQQVCTGPAFPLPRHTQCITLHTTNRYVQDRPSHYPVTHSASRYIQPTGMYRTGLPITPSYTVHHATYNQQVCTGPAFPLPRHTQCITLHTTNRYVQDRPSHYPVIHSASRYIQPTGMYRTGLPITPSYTVHHATYNQQVCTGPAFPLPRHTQCITLHTTNRYVQDRPSHYPVTHSVSRYIQPTGMYRTGLPITPSHTVYHATYNQQVCTGPAFPLPRHTQCITLHTTNRYVQDRPSHYPVTHSVSRYIQPTGMYRTGLPITPSHTVYHATYNQQVCTGPAFPLPRHTQCITLHTTNRYVQDRPSHYPVTHSVSRYIQPTGMYRTGLPITPSHTVYHATYNQQVCTGPAFPLPRHTQCITLHTTNRYVQDRPSHYPVTHSVSRYIQPTGMYRTGLPITPSHTVYHATYNQQVCTGPAFPLPRHTQCITLHTTNRYVQDRPSHYPVTHSVSRYIQPTGMYRTGLPITPSHTVYHATYNQQVCTGPAFPLPRHTQCITLHTTNRYVQDRPSHYPVTHSVSRYIQPTGMYRTGLPITPSHTVYHATYNQQVCTGPAFPLPRHTQCITLHTTNRYVQDRPSHYPVTHSVSRYIQPTGMYRTGLPITPSHTVYHATYNQQVCTGPAFPLPRHTQCITLHTTNRYVQDRPSHYPVTHSVSRYIQPTGMYRTGLPITPSHTVHHATYNQQVCTGPAFPLPRHTQCITLHTTNRYVQDRPSHYPVIHSASRYIQPTGMYRTGLPITPSYTVHHATYNQQVCTGPAFPLPRHTQCITLHTTNRYVQDRPSHYPVTHSASRYIQPTGMYRTGLPITPSHTVHHATYHQQVCTGPAFPLPRHTQCITLHTTNRYVQDRPSHYPVTHSVSRYIQPTGMYRTGLPITPSHTVYHATYNQQVCTGPAFPLPRHTQCITLHTTNRYVQDRPSHYPVTHSVSRYIQPTGMYRTGLPITPSHTVYHATYNQQVCTGPAFPLPRHTQCITLHTTNRYVQDRPSHYPVTHSVSRYIQPTGMYRTGLPITPSHTVYHATYNQQVCTGPAFPLPRHTQCITLHTTNRYVQDRPSHYPVTHSVSRYIQPTGMYRTGLPITPSHTVYHATYNQQVCTGPAFPLPRHTQCITLHTTNRYVQDRPSHYPVTHSVSRYIQPTGMYRTGLPITPSHTVYHATYNQQVCTGPAFPLPRHTQCITLHTTNRYVQDRPSHYPVTHSVSRYIQPTGMYRTGLPITPSHTVYHATYNQQVCTGPAFPLPRHTQCITLHTTNRYVQDRPSHYPVTHSVSRYIQPTGMYRTGLPITPSYTVYGAESYCTRMPTHRQYITLQTTYKMEPNCRCSVGLL